MFSKYAFVVKINERYTIWFRDVFNESIEGITIVERVDLHPRGSLDAENERVAYALKKVEEFNKKKPV